MLDKAHPKTRPKDIFLSSFFLGMTVSLIVAAVILLFVPGSAEFSSEYIVSASPVYRYIFIFDMCLFGVSGVVQLFRIYAVNYIYIFQLDPNYRIREAQINRVALLILYIWLLCFFLQIVTFKYSFLPTHSSIFTYILFISLTFLAISPFRWVYRGARVEFIRVVWHILTSPFNVVDFKDFFLADVFCSLIKPFQDIAMTACYFTSNSWIDNVEAQCSWLKTAVIFGNIMPFLWRFLQCLKKYYVTGDKFPHIVNAGKYMSTIVTMTVNVTKYWYALEWNTYYVICYVIATLYCYVWDLTMDWGLVRGGRHLFLRSKLLFPPKYYYFAIISNLTLRFAWIFTLYLDEIHKSTHIGYQGMLFFLGVCEAYRRTQWALFRVENENVNNFEKYRAILEIPQLSEEEQSY